MILGYFATVLYFIDEKIDHGQLLAAAAAVVDTYMMMSQLIKWSAVQIVSDVSYRQ